MKKNVKHKTQRNSKYERLASLSAAAAITKTKRRRQRRRRIDAQSKEQMKLYSYIFINFEICYPKVINKEMWARVLPYVNVYIFLHKCSFLCSFISFHFGLCYLFVGLSFFGCAWILMFLANIWLQLLGVRVRALHMCVHEKQSKLVSCTYFVVGHIT